MAAHSDPDPLPDVSASLEPAHPAVGRRPLPADDSVRANRYWWDLDADAYQQEHGAFLGDADFVWCPEGVREEAAQLLGPTSELAGARILEVGCGAAMCSRWLAARGARPIAFDLSAGMLRHARAGAERTGLDVPLLQADAQFMPLRTASVDHAFTSFGAVPFVADSARVMAEVARVLRPGGRWIFSTTHPMRWAFPDDPGPGGLLASGSYFDRTPYVETDDAGRATYAEHHRTIGDRVRELRAAGFVLEDLVEPEWPAGFTGTWGQWSPLRGAHFPGTAIYCCRLV
jgi:SAM-dependent methyltransferase